MFSFVRLLKFPVHGYKKVHYNYSKHLVTKCVSILPSIPMVRLNSSQSHTIVNNDSSHISDVNLESLSRLNYYQLKALAKAVGLPANQKKDKILKMLHAHFNYSAAEIPQACRIEIAAQLKSNKEAQQQASQASEFEKDFDEEFEAELLQKTIQRFEPNVDPERLRFALTYAGLQIMGRAIGLKSNSKRVILLKQINAYCDCMLDFETMEGGLRDLILPEKEDENIRRPLTASGRLRKLNRKPSIILDPELMAYATIPLSELRSAAKTMRLESGRRKSELIEALRNRRHRELAGEVFEYNDAGRVMSPEELQGLIEDKRMRMPQIKTFGTFLRTKHLKGAVSTEDGVYHVERVREVIEHLQHKGTIPRDVVLSIVEDAKNLLQQQPNVLRLSRPPRQTDGTAGCFTVCGDILGDLDNLLHIFSPQVGGFPSKTNPYLFTGDMVDKGTQSVEVLLTLLLLKLASPDSIHLLRGVHETTLMNSKFGFEKQILEQYDSEVLFQCRQLFTFLSVAATIDNKVFVVHGGLGHETSTMTIEQLNQLVDRVVEPNGTGLLSELLWADPSDSVRGFAVSGSRGGGYSFGEDITSSFLQRNELELLIRSHECVSTGYETQHSGQCVTLFSKPMYYGDDSEYPNFGAIAKFDDVDGRMTPRFVQFDTVANSSSNQLLLEDDSDDADDDYLAGIV